MNDLMQLVPLDDEQVAPSLKRTAALIGRDSVVRLQAKQILVIGVGAVGGACVEALARSGVGRLTVVDGDVFDMTNLNRQPFSASSVIGQAKTMVTCQRLADIAPTCQTAAITQFVTSQNIDALLDSIMPDGVVDAIDDLPAKVSLLEACVRRKLPVWSAMGAGRKLNPLAFKITDISKTQVCPLARNVRQQLRKRGIDRGIRCVWSSEPAISLHEGVLGSYMPVTATAGLLLAADVLHALSES